jgi:hypothetical protein
MENEGGEKFLVQNILFKICTDQYGVFGGDEYYAHKLASHELKGLINTFNYGSKLGLYLLASTFVIVFYYLFDKFEICTNDVCIDV